MAYIWFILVGLSHIVASKEIMRDDIKMKFDALIGRIEVLENKIRDQDRVIQSQLNDMASMKETINVQAYELKSQRDSIIKLRGTTKQLRSEVKRLDRRVKLFEHRTNEQRTSVTLKDTKQIEIHGKSTEPKEGQITMNTNSKTDNGIHQKDNDSETKQYRSANKAAIPRSVTRNDVRRLLSPVQTTPIAFTAYLDKTISHLGINHVIPFDKVLLNEGNAFNTHTGMFHCPQSGIYLFHFSIESERAGFMAAKLVIDGSNQLDGVADGRSGRYDMTSTTAILRVNSGQSVWVATYQVYDVTLYDTNNSRYTSFSGVLLY